MQALRTLLLLPLQLAAADAADATGNVAGMRRMRTTMGVRGGEGEEQRVCSIWDLGLPPPPPPPPPTYLPAPAPASGPHGLAFRTTLCDAPPYLLSPPPGAPFAPAPLPLPNNAPSQQAGAQQRQAPKVLKSGVAGKRQVSCASAPATFFLLLLRPRLICVSCDQQMNGAQQVA